MTNPVPIPNADYLTLPGPAWLLVVLATTIFALHLISASSAAGTILFLLTRRLTRRNRTDLDRQLNTRLIQALPMIISLTIVFGIGALIFVSALYGPYLYSANIFIANFWIAVPALILIGFVSIHLARHAALLRRAIPLIALATLCFIATIYIMTNSALLTITPNHWLSFHRGQHCLHVPDPILIPRLLYNLALALAITGLTVTWIGRTAQPTNDIPHHYHQNHAARLGLQLTCAGLALQIALGLWYLLKIPALFRTGSTTSFFSLALLLAALAIFTATKGILTTKANIAQPNCRIWLITTTILTLLATTFAVLTRQLLRTAYLAAPAASEHPLPAQWDHSQNSPLLLFAITAAATLAIIAAMLTLTCRAYRRAQKLDTPPTINAEANAQ